jgi:hypothetical protein
MKEQEPALGSDDCEGHVFVWTCPAIDSAPRRRDMPVRNAAAAAERVSKPSPNDSPWPSCAFVGQPTDQEAGDAGSFIPRAPES